MITGLRSVTIQDVGVSVNMLLQTHLNLSIRPLFLVALWKKATTFFFCLVKKHASSLFTLSSLTTLIPVLLGFKGIFVFYDLLPKEKKNAREFRADLKPNTQTAKLKTHCIWE